MAGTGGETILNVAAMGGAKAIRILSNSGSWAAAMRESGARIDHAVVVDGVGEDGTIGVRDPFAATSCRMSADDFLGYWTWAAIWQDPSPEEEA